MRVVAADIEGAALAETVDGLIGTSSFVADVARFDDVDALAEHAYESGRGYYPWPHTARYCGLI